MNTLLKNLKFFMVQQIYLWNHKWLNKQIPTGILIYTDTRKFAFFSPEMFGQTLFKLTGYQVYKEQISHYDITPLDTKESHFIAWCWRYKSFFFFAPVGSNRIYIALTRQFNYQHRRLAKLLLEEKFERRYLIHRVILNYKINKHGLPTPQEVILEQNNSKTVLASYYGDEQIMDILADVQNILRHNLNIRSLKKQS